MEPELDFRRSKPALLEDPLGADVAALGNDRNRVQFVRVTPGDRSADECRADPSTTRLLGNGDQADRAAAPRVVDVHGYVSLSTPGHVRDEHGLRPALTAAIDPGVVQVVAPVTRKPEIRIETSVGMADARDRTKGVDIGLAVRAHGHPLSRRRPLQLDANVDEAEARLLSGEDLAGLLCVDEQVEAGDAVGVCPVVRLRDDAGRATDADTPELRVPVEQLAGGVQRASVSSTTA